MGRQEKAPPERGTGANLKWDAGDPCGAASASRPRKEQTQHATGSTAGGKQEQTASGDDSIHDQHALGRHSKIEKIINEDLPIDIDERTGMKAATNVPSTAHLKVAKRTLTSDLEMLELADATQISRAMWGNNNTRGTTGTGNNEWYTPAEYLDAARCH